MAGRDPEPECSALTPHLLLPLLVTWELEERVRLWAVKVLSDTRTWGSVAVPRGVLSTDRVRTSQASDRGDVSTGTAQGGEPDGGGLNSGGGQLSLGK